MGFVNWKIVLGVMLLAYGVVKLVVGLMALLLPMEKRVVFQEHPVLKYFITMDMTVAGRVLDIVIIIFAFYSIFDGMTKLDMGRYVNRDMTLKLYVALGVFLVIFYSVVVFTNWTFISKEQDKLGAYKFTGLGSGLLFLMTAFAIFAWNSFQERSWKAVWWNVGVLMVLGVWFGVIVSESLSILAEKKKEVTTMVMIPLAGI